jgi:hypothetical protein
LARLSGYDKTSLAGEAETVMDATSSVRAEKAEWQALSNNTPPPLKAGIITGVLRGVAAIRRDK